MIKKIVMKDNIGFEQVELEIEKGLTVFTGSSGAGKSVLFNGILAAFALSESEARFVEVEFDDRLELEDVGILSEEENVVKVLKEKNAKYFINNQSVTKKVLQNLSKTFIKYLGAKENNEFCNERFLALVDTLESEQNSQFQNLKSDFQENFSQLLQVSVRLNALIEEEKKVEELKELAQNHIEKISSINPKKGEYEELLHLKKKLSKKEKIEEAWKKAEGIFEFEKAVIDALHISELSSDFFSECFNELRIIAQEQQFEEFECDIEELLDRIEQLSFLVRRYESIEKALEVLELKKKELQHYENLSFEKKELETKVEELDKKVKKSAEKISLSRKRNIPILQQILNTYLQKLCMKEACLELKENDKITYLGKDEFFLHIDTAKMKNLSSGETNRLKLAFLATECTVLHSGKGILFLDEIDANLSGKEAMSVASVLNELSHFYQIFAISHLPQLSSQARNHFLIEKKAQKSLVKRLKKEERIQELARMVSGKDITEQALEFVKTLFKD
ncbi:AAA family ATPase [Campylobacter sp. MIT 21-1685]|uniref:AAA family ATPase n=1 Tax=unclassified Campylobacter TaxID=2593542 RepID=UPI00224B9574|nr:MULTISPECIES: AAA family ATPase [unclassified Campylobacter]MCX2682376.1 AAA family ATPase [Campylobacter sp. MIT 21-1684]MCX2750656.1 AAA family ATPase [Campylobacter sp. MIT 21-1682]MCX2806796.1 AAA family ATPase [Campylobacter sp. MIT 21-1685]